MRAWPRFTFHFLQDLKLWLYFMVLLQCGRITYVISLANYIDSNSGLSEILQILLHGMRYDSVWATAFMFVPLILITIPSTVINFNTGADGFAAKLRVGLGTIFTLVTTLLYVASIEYYKEYHDFFNHFIFGLIYDDTWAIVQTIVAGYNGIQYLALAGIILYLYLKFLRKWFAIGVAPKPKLFHKEPKVVFKIFSLFIIIVFCVSAYRGSVGRRPVQLKDGAVTQDLFLNKATVTPFGALRYAYKDHKNMNNARNGMQFITKKNIINVAHDFFNKPHESNNKLASYMQKKTSGWSRKKPKHIFLIVTESYDAWSLQPKYNELKLNDNLKRLAKKGLHLKSFLPASVGTMESFNAVITGLQDANVHTNYQVNSRKIYETTYASHFKKLGYKAQFFYGGYLSWQRIGEFMQHQGFDNIYGAPHMSDWSKTTEWGVDDADLFSFILKHIDNDKPSFNVILTTSNHPPFVIDLDKAGFDKDAVSKIVQKKYPNSPATVKQLGHLWYSDKTIGEFVDIAENKFDSTLFAVTGDHYGRRHVLPNPPLYDTSAVPLVIYGKGITEGLSFPKNAAGSHIDIGVTLLEMSAPKGFKYYSLGQNLFNPKSKLGIGNNVVITKDWVASVYGEPVAESINGQKVNVSKAELQKAKEKHDDAKGISWWRIIKGNDMEELR